MISALLFGLALYLIGRFLVRRLGWPHNIEDCAQWGLALYAATVLANGIPKFIGALGTEDGRAPSVSGSSLAWTLLILVLGATGYFAWHRRDEKPSNEARLVPRRRALPPPPQTHVHDEHFTIINDPDHEK